jgi:hypothetical protein
LLPEPSRKVRHLPSNGKGAATRPHHSQRSQLPIECSAVPKGHEMKALGIAAATAIALAPLSVAATTPDVARAAPCVGVFANPTSCQNCLHFVEVYHTSNVCEAAPSRPAQAPPSGVPVQTPETLPEPALPSVTPVQTQEAPPEPALPEPALPSVTPVQTQEVVSPSPPSPSTIPVTAHEPTQPTQPWWPVALGYGVLAIAAALAAYGARI